MYLGKADVNTYNKGAGREFLVTNGLGSYGFSTVIGANTRREHGLLVVRPKGSTRQSVLVSKIEETLVTNKKKYQLSTNRYKDLVYPDGYRFIQEYSGNPFPSMLFIIHSIFLKKTIFMPQGESCTVVKYQLLSSPQKIELKLNPLFAHRMNCDIVTSHEKDEFLVATRTGTDIEVDGRGVKSFCSTTSGTWNIKPQWYENIVYEQDDRTGGAATESLWSPGTLSLEMNEGDIAYLVLSNSPVKYTVAELTELEKKTAEKIKENIKQAVVPTENEAVRDMIMASYHLVDDNRKGRPARIYTGYPSVEIKSRDTFVSLPGLTLATGRDVIAASILRGWIEKCAENGFVMPGRMNDDGTTITDAADSGLWFINAASKYLEKTGYAEADKDIYDAILKVADKYLEGIPELDIIVTENNLLSVEGQGQNPSRHWMDTVVDGEPVVVRTGCLVELNALWYNSQMQIVDAAAAYGDKDAEAKYAAGAEKTGVAIRETFWNNGTNGLYDWVSASGNSKSSKIRPNQIFAVSLKYCALTEEMAQNVIKLCWNELYTTYGLRTLNPGSDKFKGSQEGREDQQQKAMFRGTAWTWVLGEFISAYLKFNPTKKEVGWTFFRPFIAHLRHGCVGAIAQYFDGTMPYRPHGDVNSAMALGEMLRVLYEDLEKK